MIEAYQSFSTTNKCPVRISTFLSGRVLLHKRVNGFRKVFVTDVYYLPKGEVLNWFTSRGLCGWNDLPKARKDYP